MLIKPEDKQKICDSLLGTLQETMAGKWAESLTYIKTASGEEYVRITYKDGHGALACVTGDSGLALICDVLNKIK